MINHKIRFLPSREIRSERRHTVLLDGDLESSMQKERERERDLPKGSKTMNRNCEDVLKNHQYDETSRTSSITYDVRPRMAGTTTYGT